MRSKRDRMVELEGMLGRICVVRMDDVWFVWRQQCDFFLLLMVLFLVTTGFLLIVVLVTSDRDNFRSLRFMLGETTRYISCEE